MTEVLARLQKTITICLVLAACLWLAYFWTASPWLAIAGFVGITCGYIGFLGLEFVALWFVNRADPAPHPTLPELLNAWVGETLTAPLIFCWRQPFRHQAIPDQLSGHGQRGVVFVHGFFCNRGFWTSWLRRLQKSGHAFAAVSLEPVFGSIDGYAEQIDRAVQAMTAATGKAPLIVCHSMGGLAVRAWLRTMKSDTRVHHVVTIGSPHRGTWLARFGHADNGRQMRLDADWQRELDLDMPADRHTRFTCWYSNCDNIVFPTSTATLPGADNRLIRGAAHVQMAFLPQVMESTLALLD